MVKIEAYSLGLQVVIISLSSHDLFVRMEGVEGEEREREERVHTCSGVCSSEDINPMKIRALP